MVWQHVPLPCRKLRPHSFGPFPTRCADDFGHGPPAPVVLKGPGTITRPPPREQVGAAQIREVTVNAVVDSQYVCGSTFVPLL